MPLPLGSPCMVETVAAEVVFAGELDGLVEGRVAYEADKVAVAGSGVLDEVDVGGDFGDSALSTLRAG